VVGVGVDLVERSRVERSLARWGERLVEKLMDPPEAMALPTAGPERARALALAIAGKEATSKALGTGWSRGVRWRDVEVERAAPAVRLLGRAREVASELGSSGACVLALEERGDLVLGRAALLSAE
jgi:holo-[acyl-carrier protein] synthase